MARKKRKIGFYYISVRNDALDLQSCYLNVINHINQLDKIGRKKIITGSKFGLLDTISSFNNNERHQLIFKSATNNFRPPLLDRYTITERDSPKTISEGETHKTHLISKMINGDLIVIIENYRDGVNIKQIIKYLNSFSENLPNPCHFRAEMIVKNNFLEEMNALDRVIAAEIYVDKQLLGSEALNYSERINSVKHEVVISAKAKNRDSIADFARDIYGVFSGSEQRISRIRLTGKNNDNNLIIINTDRIERQEYVDPEIDENTGEILTAKLLEEMEVVIFNF